MSRKFSLVRSNSDGTTNGAWQSTRVEGAAGDDTALGANTVVLIVEDSASKADVMDAYRAAGRALKRAFQDVSETADIPTASSVSFE